MLRTAFFCISIFLSTEVQGQDEDPLTWAARNGSCNTFVNLVVAAGLDSELRAGDSCTVFIPNDAAFKKLPNGKLKELLRPKNKEELKSILSYHIAGGLRLPVRKALYFQNARSLNGDNLTFAVNQGRILVDDSVLLDNDIECKNTTIHVIDQVLKPSGKTEPTLTR